nr:molybdopterin-binding protein [Paracoccus sp. NBH48]
MTDAGIDEGTVSAVAINDYAVQIPVDEVTADYPIVAFQQNGQAMSVRDKGPLWVIYPYDSDPALQSEVTYARSIWQLVRIEVVR